MIHKEFPMSVLDRSALSDSPLADLHAIASELSIDGYRRLRRPELIDAILTRQGSEDAGAVDEAPRPTTLPSPIARRPPTGRPRRPRAAAAVAGAAVVAARRRMTAPSTTAK